MNFIKNIDHDGQKVKLYHADHIAVRAVAALIFKNLSDQLRDGYMIPNINWSDFGNAQAVWLTDDNDNVLGGICFNYNQDYYLINIMCIFETEKYSDHLHEHCMQQLKVLAKQSGLNGCFQVIHHQDTKNLEKAANANMSLTFHMFTRSLINDTI